MKRSLKKPLSTINNDDESPHTTSIKKQQREKRSGDDDWNDFGFSKLQPEPATRMEFYDSQEASEDSAELEFEKAQIDKVLHSSNSIGPGTSINTKREQREDEIIDLRLLEQEVTQKVDLLQENLKNLHYEIADLESRLSNLIAHEASQGDTNSDRAEERNAFYTEFIEALDLFVAGKNIDLAIYFDQWEARFKDDYLEAKGLNYKIYFS
jgi:hypothetical protein